MIKLPCHLLEPEDPNRVFVGQQQVLDAIQTALVVEDKPKDWRGEPECIMRQFALCGPGGVGKTEVAAEFARRNRDNFDAIFWVRADGFAKLDQCFAEMSLELGLETADQLTNQRFSRSRVTSWLECSVREENKVLGDRNPAFWLLIFDGADDPDLLENYWPRYGHGSVLVTSRNPLIKEFHLKNTCKSFSRTWESLDMEPMSDADGGALLLKLARLDADTAVHSEETAREISRSLAGLPLAIAQVSETIRRQGLSLSEFQGMLEKDRQRIAPSDTEHHATVWTIERLSAEAKDLLKLMLFMDADIMQEKILCDAAVQVFGSSSFTLAKFNEVCTELLQSTLIHKRESKTELLGCRISVSRLVQDAIQSRMTGEEMQSNFTAMVDFLWRTWPPATPALPAPTKPSKILERQSTDIKYATSRPELCLALYPHVIQLEKLWPLISGCNDGTKIRFAALLTEAGWYRQETGILRGFDGFFDNAKSICESLPGDDSDAVLYTINFYVGLIFAGTNDPKLAREHKEANMALQLAVCRSVGPDFVDLRLALAHIQLAIALAQDGQLDESIAAFNRGREIRRSLGSRQLVSSDASHAMALMLRGSPGDLETAEKMVLDSIELWESTGSVVSSKIARHFQALGKLRYMQGRFDESYDCDKKALKYFMESTGVHSCRAGDMHYKCVMHLVRLELYHEALPVSNAAWKCWDPNSLFLPEVARNHWMRGKLFDGWGEEARGTTTFRTAARVRRWFVSDKRVDGRAFTQEEFDCLVDYRSR